jgi:hypothetical protein
LALQVGGVSRTGTIKYDLDSRGTVLARNVAKTVDYRPVLSSERALQNNKPAAV